MTTSDKGGVFWSRSRGAAGGGRPMKLVSECLGVARSQLTVGIKHSVSPKVRRSRPEDDAELVVEIQQQVNDLPSYGYRRVWGLLRRARETRPRPM